MLKIVKWIGISAFCMMSFASSVWMVDQGMKRDLAYEQQPKRPLESFKVSYNQTLDWFEGMAKH